MKWLLPLTLVLGFTASAADVSGTWKAATETPNGTIETTFKLKADGEKLTGSTSNQFMGETAISEGKVDGDNISFVVNASFNGNDMKLNFKGKVAADELKLTLDIPGRDAPIEMTAKRTS